MAATKVNLDKVRKIKKPFHHNHNRTHFFAVAHLSFKMCPFRSSYDRVLKLVARWRLIRFLRGLFVVVFQKEKWWCFTHYWSSRWCVRSRGMNDGDGHCLTHAVFQIGHGPFCFWLINHRKRKEKKPTEFSFFLVESFLPLVVTSLASSICKHFFQKFK